MNKPQNIHKPQPFRLLDLRVGDPNDPDPLEEWSWEELRDVINEERGGT